LRNNTNSLRYDTNGWNLKSWFKEILSVFKNYVNKLPSEKGILDIHLYNALITKNDLGEEVSIFNSKQFSDGEKFIKRDGYDDISLAKKVFDILIDLLGRYAVDNMLQGSLYVQEDYITKIAKTKSQFINVHKFLDLTLFNKDTLSIGSSFYDPRNYQSILLDSQFMAQKLKLPTEGSEVTYIIIPQTDRNFLDPFYKMPSGDYWAEQKLYNSFYETFSFVIFNEFQREINRRDFHLENRLSGLTKLYSTLANAFEESIYNKYNTYIEKGLTDDDIWLWCEIGKRSLFQFLFSFYHDNTLRTEIFRYFDSFGKEVVNLKFNPSGIFSMGSLSDSIKEIIADFYTLELTSNHWPLFEDHLHTFTNSLNIDISRDVYYDSKLILQSQKEQISMISSLLKNIVKQHGKIRIYGYNSKLRGFSRKSSGKLIYYPESRRDLDAFMPGSSNDKFFELDIDTNGRVFFSGEDGSRLDSDHMFQFLLAALFADHQLLVIRKEGMETGEILFAFSWLIEGLLPSDIISAKGIRPGYIGKPLYTNNMQNFLELAIQWRNIQQSFRHNGVFVGIHKPIQDLDIWFSHHANGIRF
jgi:hypothetical protein